MWYLDCFSAAAVQISEILCSGVLINMDFNGRYSSEQLSRLRLHKAAIYNKKYNSIFELFN